MPTVINTKCSNKTWYDSESNGDFSSSPVNTHTENVGSGNVKYLTGYQRIISQVRGQLIRGSSKRAVESTDKAATKMTTTRN